MCICRTPSGQSISSSTISGGDVKNNCSHPCPLLLPLLLLLPPASAATTTMMATARLAGIVRTTPADVLNQAASSVVGFGGVGDTPQAQLVPNSGTSGNCSTSASISPAVGSSHAHYQQHVQATAAAAEAEEEVEVAMTYCCLFSHRRHRHHRGL